MFARTVTKTTKAVLNIGKSKSAAPGALFVRNYAPEAQKSWPMDSWKSTSPSWIDKNTKVICQGLTGKQVWIC